jgi:two-component system NtrC family sensor kinase
MIKYFKVKVPLFWKFSIAIVVIVLVFGTINSVLIYQNVKSSLEEETRKRALFIANSITRQVTSLVLFEDYIGLQNIIYGIKEIDSSISYIFILDNKNDVVVHTFEGKFPLKLLGINSINDSTQLYSSKTFKLINESKIDNDGELILDIAVPLLNKRV